MRIQNSDIKALEKRVVDLNYKYFLQRIDLNKVRAFENQQIRFEFPVTALIGTNGGGKSTILGAAALAYKSTTPRTFFPKSSIGDDSMANWTMRYDLVDRTRQSSAQKLTRTASFANLRWNRSEPVERPVLFLPILRTVPAGEQTRFQRFIRGNSADTFVREDIPERTRKFAGAILGKDLENYVRFRDPNSGAELYVNERSNNGYSQFHFGAGEASIISIVDKIENTDDYSLVLIEEIENGLHPVAIRELVAYLVDVAKTKKHQILFTTHSNAAIQDLPSSAIWASIDGKLIQGKLSIDSLRAISGEVNHEYVIFVEDQFAKTLVEDALRQRFGSNALSIEVHAVGGYPYVTQVLDYHNKNPSVTNKAVALVDGDVAADLPDHAGKLPGEAPEALVYEYINNNIDSVSALLQQRLQVPHIQQDSIKVSMKKIYLSTTDHHAYFSELGNELGFLSEIVVRGAFVSVFNQQNSSVWAETFEFLQEHFSSLR